MWQRGVNDTLSLYQKIRGAQDDGGSYANVSQLGRQNLIDLRQVGRHSANLTQGLGQKSMLTLTQYDSGGSGVSGDENARQPGAVFRGENAAVVAQYGDRNTISSWQEGSKVNATLWQKLGSSDNSMTVNQGRRSSDATGAPACEPACQFASGGTATVTQAGRFNSASLHQYAASSASVEQLGTGTRDLPNVAYLAQTGAGNSATLLQSAGVGPSSSGDPASGNSAAQNQQQSGNPSATADPHYCAGGARGAEARLLQSGTNSTASVEQRGRGQFALIEQQGSANQASIVQDSGATNATAIIQQGGSGNSYSLTQTEAGQYMLVTQSGTNNSVTDVVRRGPGS